jgi:hypothetical protein
MRTEEDNRYIMDLAAGNYICVKKDLSENDKKRLSGDFLFGRNDAV